MFVPKSGPWRVLRVRTQDGLAPTQGDSSVTMQCASVAVCWLVGRWWPQWHDLFLCWMHVLWFWTWFGKEVAIPSMWPLSLVWQRVTIPSEHKQISNDACILKEKWHWFLKSMLKWDCACEAIVGCLVVVWWHQRSEVGVFWLLCAYVALLCGQCGPMFDFGTCCVACSRCKWEHSDTVGSLVRLVSVWD